MSTRAGYKELLSRSRSNLPYSHPVSKLSRSCSRRAWIGTWWPWAADAIARYRIWRIGRTTCRTDGCDQLRGHAGLCGTECICGRAVPAGGPCEECAWEDLMIVRGMD